jgi:hypothetical protein
MGSADVSMDELAPANDIYALALANDINAEAEGFYLPLVSGMRRRGLPIPGAFVDGGGFPIRMLATFVEGDAELTATAARLRDVGSGLLSRADYHASFKVIFAAYA